MIGHGPDCCDRVDGIRGYGELEADVMLLGIAPGRQEAKQGRPFIGPSGKLNDATMAATGYSREKCYATNLICWWKDEPTPTEIDVCSARLADEIRTIAPRLIVSLGALATERLIGRKIGKARGAIVRPEQILPEAWGYKLAQEVGFCVLPTWHPAAILRVPSMGSDLVRDFLKIPRFLNGELNTPEVRLHLVDDPNYAWVVWQEFRNQLVAVDVETANDSEDAFEEVISLAAARYLQGELHSWVFTRKALEGIKDWYADEIRWVFHNGQFDTQAIYRTFGVWLSIVEDTMLLSYACDERPGYEEGKDKRGASHGPGNHGLKQLARELLSAGWYEEETKGTLGKSLEEIASPQLIPMTEAEIEESGLPLPGASRLRGEADDLQTPAPLKKAKPKVRFETQEEAQTRFEAWLTNFYKYNGLDAAYTLCLLSRLPTDRDEACYRDILIPAANAYKEIQYHGIKVDQDRLRELVAEFRPRLETMQKALQIEAHELGYRNTPRLKRDQKARDLWEAAHGEGSWPLGIPEETRKAMAPDELEAAKGAYERLHGKGSWPGYEPLNIGSNKQMGEFLFGLLRLKPKMFTKKGGVPSTSADHMEMLDHPFCTKVAETNQWAHIISTYYIGAAEHIKADSKFHAYPWPHGTTTGRRAYTGPAMQTFPQDYTVGPELARIREIIVPSEPDMVLIEADYEQIEVWIGALLSGDQNMLADLQQPYLSTTGETKPNYHSRVAREILGCEAPDDSDEFKAARQLAKVVTFSAMYLVEEDHFGTIISRPKQEAKRILRGWYKRYDDYAKWQKRILQEMRRVGEITTPFGYRRRFPVVLDHTADKQAVNHPIQSVGGTFSLLALVELNETLKPLGAHVLLDVHDSLLVECSKRDVPEVCGLIRTAMCNPRIDGWPQLKIEIKIGDNWGSKISEEKWLATNLAAV